ncbi:DNA-binding protein [Mesorhizobium sp. Root102]|uniref:ParB/RepB/Spo0J family partition protein n=1 Tax=Mesorhizobium sp. Root102 TaxID=1736422 RepID=UPI0006F42154|nr:ParB/RepB/Spo0J family partition protein [Mesorhizobium sp. Root102]KQU81782.1 DNA-binding protein [Mesorhizobium sp. Root102]
MAKATQKITMNPSQNIPFDKLVLSQKNVRRIKNGVTIEELAADIAHRRLLESLNVRPMLDEKREETGMFEVPAGGRRFLAIELLVKQKKFARTETVPCVVNRSDTTSAEEDSLAENFHRERLHPLDEFRAFKTLSDQGLEIEQIASRFHVTPAYVRQRLKLASISPKLLALYEQSEMRYDQLQAFSITDDQARQEQVWETVSRSQVKEAYYIRRLLTETAVRATDRRAVYVGIEAYEAAGGVVMRDLFEQDQGGWLQDPAVLEQLVFEKLKVDAETLKTREGWKWVEAALDFPYGHTSGLRRFYGEPREMSGDELARHDAIKAEYDRLDAEYAEAEEYSEETETRLDELGTALDALNDRPYVYDPEAFGRGGAFVSVGADGQLKVESGFVRPEDEPVGANESGDEADAEDRGDDGHAATAGNGVSVNGKPVSPEGEEEDDGVRPLPDRLVLDLTAARTLALRNALAGDPTMAFIAVLHAFVLKTFYVSSSNSCLDLTVQSATFGQTQGLAETPWAKGIEQRHEEWGHDLPKEPDALWAFLLDLDEVSRQALFAHCASLSLNAVLEPWNRRPRALAHADQLAHTIGFDMVEAGWVPTVDNYLGRVTKTRILEAVREAKGEQSAQLIDHLKKPDMAREAARLLEGSSWLPEPLRLAPFSQTVDAVDDVGDEPVEDGSTDAAEELPAFLADQVETDVDDTVDSGGDHLQAAE